MLRLPALSGEVSGESWSQECVLYILIAKGSKKKEKEEEMEEIPALCLFCLEEIKERDRCGNPVGCGCELTCHGSCLQEWYEQKQQIECPICHRVSVPNPIIASRDREIVIIHVQDPQQAEQIRTMRAQEKCVGCCCLTLLFWWVFSLIFEYAF